MMRAVRIHQYGRAESLRCETVASPRPQRGELLIEQRFAGVNFADVYMRNGLYHGQHTYGTGLPMTLGLEGAGFVRSVGEGVSNFVPGMRVGWCLGTAGYAELVSVPAEKAVVVPEWCELDVAAALMLQGATSHYLTHSLFDLNAGHSCLIHAGAGGVGRLLIQIAKSKGAWVATTVGSEEKAQEVRALGADLVVLYREEDFEARTRDATDGRGVDVVYDSVGRATIHKSLKCLAVRGTCVLFGASSGPVDSIVPMDLAEAGSVFFTRPHLAHYRRNAEEAQQRANAVFDLVRAGKLQPRIDQYCALEEAVDAHRRLEARQTRGKILLTF